MKKQTIKPCPGCGKIPPGPYEVVGFELYDEMGPYATSPMNNEHFFRIHCNNSRCRLLIMTKIYKSKKSAVEAWNKRSGEK